MEKWKHLTHEFNNDIFKILHIQHLAAQFIALTGRYLLPQKEDKSNITMQYFPEQEMFLGQQHPEGWLVGLLLKNLELQIRDDNMTVISKILLEGRTFPEVLIEFKKELHKTGTDVSLLKTEQPYELPSDFLDKGMFFSTSPQHAVNENIKYRHNAKLLLNEVRSGFAESCPVYTWPNHFDTGFSFPVEHNKEGKETKTIGMGWAIPDDVVDEPYYYVSFMSDDHIDEFSKPGKLAAGKWMMPKWNGAVLKLSEIINEEIAETQFRMVKSFFELASRQITEHFKISH